MQNINQKTIGSVAHLAAFSKYFIPFGNFLIPIFIWVIHKQKPFVSGHAKRSLNFQISIFLYAAILATIAVAVLVVMGVQMGSLGEFYFSNQNTFVVSDPSPFLSSPYIFIAASIIIVGLGLFSLEIICTISAAIKAGEGKIYKYPLSIQFIKLEDKELIDLQEEYSQQSTL
jgi:uncharacterized Tic20 family protein